MPLDEQTEAEFVKNIRKDGGITLRNTTFKVRKDFYTDLIKRGMPPHVVDKVVGQMIIRIPENGHGTEVYNAAFEVASKNIYDLWELYSKEISEGVFIESCCGFCFALPVC